LHITVSAGVAQLFSCLSVFRVEAVSALTLDGSMAPDMDQTINVEIRRAGLEDVDAIAAAHLDSIRSVGALYYEPQIVSDWGARVRGDLYAKAMARAQVFEGPERNRAGEGGDLPVTALCW
jgi:hypothetical protein